MKDILLIFVVILVLLMLVGILGGSVHSNDFKFSSSPAPSPFAAKSPGRMMLPPSHPPSAHMHAHMHTHMPSLPPSPGKGCPYRGNAFQPAQFERFVEDESYSYQPIEYEVVDNENQAAEETDAEMGDAPEEDEQDDEATNMESVQAAIEQHNADLNAVVVDEGAEPIESLETFTEQAQIDEHQHHHHAPSQVWDDTANIEPFEGRMYASF